MAEPWVDINQVCAHLGAARDTVYRWIESRKLPAHRIGRIWKFKLSEIDEWVRNADDKQTDAEGRTFND